MRQSRIYVANFSGHNINRAFEHTNLPPPKAQVNLTEGNIDIFNVDRLIYLIKEKLRNSQPNDLLLLCGSSMINCIAFSQWLQKHGRARLLIYHAKKKGYVLREITDSQMFADL